MGKHGPCRHCGVTSTPLWRNGPPEKPVLCNACGSRWRTKGSLANYAPFHAREPIHCEEPRIAKRKCISYKTKEQKLQKRKQINDLVEYDHEILFSKPEQNCLLTFECDASNRSSSGSATSYSESCANFNTTDASDWAGSVLSNTTQIPVPSKKSAVHIKPSSVDKLTMELYSIWNEQQSSNLTGSLEEDLLFEGKTPIDSFEIGHGGVLLRYPISKVVEEESEASSIPADNKQVCEAFSRSSSSASFSHICLDKIKKPIKHVIPENIRRETFLSENLDFLQDSDSLLGFLDLKDIVNFGVFMELLTCEEQLLLMKYLPSVDTTKYPESLRCLFTSPQFEENLSYFQQLLRCGLFDLSFWTMNIEEVRTLKRLVVLGSTNCRWVEHHKHLKRMQVAGERKVENWTSLTPIKNHHEEQIQQLQVSKESMMSPNAYETSSTNFPSTKSSVITLSDICSNDRIDTKDLIYNEGTYLGPESLTQLFTDESFDQHLLLNQK
ncbi:hypothetical protein HPP92_025368 [Vanilla planifolia]|uniref:GATA transcription factor 26 n=1 Tax=Vanilla planifolia TaxID=51239 RepID=A0A835PLT5_VANPL|nr:hypothetical protein HPP92_025670 [Vanilla planifolia]KAG0454064.1 hypothetical protein HPP92_025368 [Vanilla planifolia]